MISPQKVTTGRIVHVVLPESFARTPGQPPTRPAIVVEPWEGEDKINVQVFLDSSNDAASGRENLGMLWLTSVHYDEAGAPGTWHWPAKA